MAWQSPSGMGGGNGAGNGGQDANHQANQPQGTEYTLQGVMRFLQTEWHRHERDRNAWEIERQEMKARIASLEGAGRRADAQQKSLKRYCQMLENVVAKERKSKGANGTAEPAKEDKLKDEKKKEELKKPKEDVRPAEPKPHNSFLAVDDDNSSKASLADQDRSLDRQNLLEFLEQSAGEFTYLMVTPSNPNPPREPPPSPPNPEEIAMAHSYSLQQGQPSIEEYYQQHNVRQKSMREQHSGRSMQNANHAPPPVPSNLPMRNQDPPTSAPMVRSISEQQPLPSASSSEWRDITYGETPGDENAIKIIHSYDSFGRPIANAKEMQQATPVSESDAWDFNETAHFPEQQETKAAPLPPPKPETDAFPLAQDPPKSPNKGTSSHRRKSSMSRRRSNEADLALNSLAQQKAESGQFKVRFGLRGHLDAVRAVIFSGGGSPGEPEICTAGDDGVIKRWILPSRFENQGSTFISTAHDLDVQSYFTHRGHQGSILCLAAYSPSQNFSSSGRQQGDGWVFSGGQDASVRIWERGRVDPKATLDGHTDAVWALCVLPGTTSTIFSQNLSAVGGSDRILLVSGAADGTVKVWSVTAPPQLMSPSTGSRRAAGGRVRGNSMSSGSGFPSSPQPNMISSNHPFHYTLIHSISRPNSSASPTCISPLSPSGENFVVAYSDAAVLVYDTKTGEEISSMQSLETYDGTPSSTGINCVTATSTGLDGSLTEAAGGAGGRLGEEEAVVHGATGSSGGGGVEGTIISGHEDRYIRFYDANSGQCTYTMLAHPAAISALSLSPDGHELVSGGHDASLRFWSLDKRTCAQEITTHRLMRGEGVCAVVWSSDGRWVVSGGGDGVVKVFAR